MKKRAFQTVPAMVLVLFLGAAGCKQSTEKAAKSSTANDPLKVQTTPELLKSITIGSPQWKEVTTQQKAAARVQTDASRVARIGSPVEGRITRVLVFEGQRVREGDVLAMLHSNALSDTQFAFVKACSQDKLSEAAAERARQLVQSDVIGKAELQKREAEVLQNGLRSLHCELNYAVLGMSEASIQKLETTRKLNSEYPIIASISGTVIERKVTIGQVIQPADPAFLVADLSNLWFVADVAEQHAGALAIGKTVIATIPALPGEAITGRLSFVSPVVNPRLARFRRAWIFLTRKALLSLRCSLQ